MPCAASCRGQHSGQTPVSTESPWSTWRSTSRPANPLALRLACLTFTVAALVTNAATAALVATRFQHPTALAAHLRDGGQDGDLLAATLHSGGGEDASRLASQSHLGPAQECIVSVRFHSGCKCSSNPGHAALSSLLSSILATWRYAPRLSINTGHVTTCSWATAAGSHEPRRQGARKANLCRCCPLTSAGQWRRRKPSSGRTSYCKCDNKGGQHQ